MHTKFTSQLNKDRICTLQELQAKSSNQGICTLAWERVWKQGMLESNDISPGLHQVVGGSAGTVATMALGVGFGKVAGILSIAAISTPKKPDCLWWRAQQKCSRCRLEGLICCALPRHPQYWVSVGLPIGTSAKAPPSQVLLLPHMLLLIGDTLRTCGI